jgi:hypothetical protein
MMEIRIALSVLKNLNPNKMSKCIITKEYIQELYEWIDLILKEAGYSPYTIILLKERGYRHTAYCDMITESEVRDYVAKVIMEPIIQDLAKYNVYY